MVWLQNYLETLFHPAATIAHTMKHRSLIQPAIALTGKCSAFSYDPLLRRPKVLPPIRTYTPEDFTL